MRHRKVTITIKGAPLASVPAGVAGAVDAKPKDVSLSYVFEDGRKPITQYRHPITGEVVESRPSNKGTKVGKDEHGEKFALVPLDKWNAVNEQIKLDIVGFVPKAEVEARIDRVSEVHYVQTQPGIGPAALAMIAAALREEDAAAICDFSVGGKCRLGALVVGADGIMRVLTLVHPEYVKVPDDEVRCIAEAEVAEEQVEMVKALIEQESLDAAEALDEVHDESLAARRAILEKVIAGEEIVEGEAVETPAGQDLTAALAASLGAAKGKKKKAKAAA